MPDQMAIIVQELESEASGRLWTAGHPMSGSVRQYFMQELRSNLKQGTRLPDLGVEFERYDEMIPKKEPEEFEYPFTTVNQAREAFGFPPLNIVDTELSSAYYTLISDPALRK